MIFFDTLMVYYRAIVEKALTSGEYVSLFQISILNVYIYIWNLKKELCDNWLNFWRNNAKTDKQRKLRKWRDQRHHFFILKVTMPIVIVYRPQ